MAGGGGGVKNNTNKEAKTCRPLTCINCIQLLKAKLAVVANQKTRFKPL